MSQCNDSDGLGALVAGEHRHVEDAHSHDSYRPDPLDRPPLDSRGSVVLSEVECYQLLASASGGVGRLGFRTEASVTVLPVNYMLIGRDIMFRLGPGEMLESFRSGAEFAFEIDHVDSRRQTPEAWSVSAHGTAHIVEDPIEISDAASSGLTPLIPEASAVYVRMRLTAVSGRRFVVNALAWSRVQAEGSTPDRFSGTRP